LYSTGVSFESIILIFYILVGIGAIIFVHELGHFVTAKMAGVRVEAFSLGFYPTFLGFRRTFNGLLVGFLPGFFRTGGPEVGGIEEGSPADRAGLRIGDLILEINGRKTGCQDYGSLKGLVPGGEGPVPFKVLRREKPVEITVESPSGADSLEALGILPHLSEQKRVLRGDQASWAVGCKDDERVIKAAGRTFENREEFREFVLEAVRKGAGVVRLDVARGEEETAGRRLALAVRPQVLFPKLSFFLPFLQGVTGETEYRLSVLPIGGYVKMAGDIPGETTGASDEFLGKSVGARGMVFVAGSLMNAVFGVLCFIMAYQVGVQSIAPEVGNLFTGYPADRAGLEIGDRVVSINGKPVKKFMDIPQEVAYAPPDRGLRFEVLRNGEKIILPPKDKPPAKSYYDSETKRQMAGIVPVYVSRIESMDRKGPMYKKGIRPKDDIVSLAGTAISRGMQKEVEEAFQKFLDTRTRDFSVVVERNGKRLAPISVTIPEDARKVWRLGVGVEWKTTVLKTPETGPAQGRLRQGDRLHLFTYKFHLKGVHESLKVIKEMGKYPFTVHFQVERDGEARKVPIELKEEGEVTALIESLETGDTSIVVKDIRARSHLKDAGIPVGAEILKLNGSAFSSQKEVFEKLDAAGSQPVEVEWRAPGDGTNQKSKVRLVWSYGITLGDLGIKGFRQKREYLRLSFFPSVVEGLAESKKFAGDVFRTLRGIFLERNLGGSSIGGPVTIAVASYHFAEYGFGKLLFFLGLLSINLAIINLFPIPILDGGHLLFLLIEKVKGSPVSETGQALAQYAGLLILVSLMIYVTRNDILRLLP
jgi:regulator of sigma E protease